VQLNREGILDGDQPPYYNIFGDKPSTFQEANHAVVPHRQKYGNGKGYASDSKVPMNDQLVPQQPALRMPQNNNFSF